LTPRRIEEVTGPVGTGRVLERGLLENTVALHGSEPLTGARLWTSPVFDLVGIRYVLLSPGTALQRDGLTVAYDAPDGRIFRNDAALPRAFLVNRGRCADDREARRLIAARAVDFRREVLLAECAEPVPPAAEAPPGGTARITGQGPHTVQIRVTAERSTFLVLTDTWYPGWTARVDGQPTRLWRANHAFRAVRVAAGEHVVEFRYEPAWLMPGLVISAVSLAVVGAMLATGRS
jgi:hypothetical protein